MKITYQVPALGTYRGIDSPLVDQLDHTMSSWTECPRTVLHSGLYSLLHTPLYRKQSQVWNWDMKCSRQQCPTPCCSSHWIWFWSMIHKSFRSYVGGTFLWATARKYCWLLRSHRPMYKQISCSIIPTGLLKPVIARNTMRATRRHAAPWYNPEKCASFCSS